MKGMTEWNNNRPEGIGNEDLQKIWKASSSYRESYAPDVEKAWSKFQARISEEPKVVSMRPSFSILKMAAALALLAVAGLFFKRFLGSGPSLEKMVTLDTQHKSLGLSDGTLVTLNAASKLLFPKKFSELERRVVLDGEAFFEVARDEAKPFLIETENAQIKVLGTSFNVKSYTGKGRVEVYVKSGKVAVRILDKNKEYILSAGDHLKFDAKKKEANVVADFSGNPMAWKSGRLKFKNEYMGSIFSTLESLHGVHFKMTDPKLANCPFTINLNVEKIDDALRSFEEACGLRFIKNSQTEYVVNGNCCE